MDLDLGVRVDRDEIASAVGGGDLVLNTALQTEVDRFDFMGGAGEDLRIEGVAGKGPQGGDERHEHGGRRAEA